MAPAEKGAEFVAISAEPLSLDRVSSLVSHAGAGAIVTFVGTVRDINEGRAVTLLEYEAYESMARAELRRIKLEIESEIAGTRLAVHHRVGALSVGAAAVVCAASAPHRSEAFRACRLLIDRVKARVPIWKREHGPDGPYWVGWEDARCDGAESHAHEHRHEPAETHEHAHRRSHEPTPTVASDLIEPKHVHDGPGFELGHRGRDER